MDRTGLPNSGTILAGNFHFRDETISGTVDIVDGGKYRTLANTAFVSGQTLLASAGNLPTVQLFNPLASARRCSVSKLYVSSGIAGIVRMGWNSAAIGITSPAANSKLAGGALSVTQGAQASMAGLPAGFQYLVQMNLQANLVQVIELREPIVLPEGFGLVLQHLTVAADINVNFELTEEKL